MADLGKLVRVAMVKALKAYPPLTNMVPAGRVYGPEAPGLPEWPWAYVQTPLETPDRLSCMRGARLSVTVHGFAKGPGDDDASAIGDAIKRALDGVHFSLDDATADVLHEQTQIIRDSAEASAYHAIVRFGVAVAA